MFGVFGFLFLEVYWEIRVCLEGVVMLVDRLKFKIDEELIMFRLEKNRFGGFKSCF